MAHLTAAILILATCVSLSSAQQFVCEDSYCKTRPCDDVTCDNGRLVKNATECGCCHVCSKYLETGAPCTTLKLGNVPREECGPGLWCSSTSKTCQPASTSCVRSQMEHDRKLNWTLGRPRPDCDDFGHYKPVQCKRGMLCYCVDSEGKRIFGTSPYTEDSANLCRCSRDYEEFSAKPDREEDFLRCKSNGDYDALQCTDRYCFCIDNKGRMDGQPQLRNSSLSTLKCYNNSVHYSDFSTPCWRRQQLVLKQIANLTTEGFHPVGLELMTCDLDGTYAPVQCAGNECYCVNRKGVEYEKTRVKRFSDAVRDMNCRCLREKEVLQPDKRKNKVTEMFYNYKCDVNGNYNPLQCFDPFCFCVDENGFQHGEAFLKTKNSVLSCVQQARNRRVLTDDFKL